MGFVNLGSFMQAVRVLATQTSHRFAKGRPAQLTIEEEAIHRGVFSAFPPKKFFQLVQAGSWVSSPAGERWIERGRPIESVALIVNGRVRMSDADRVVGDLGPAAVVGSTLYLSGVIPDVDAVTVEPTRAIQWPIKTLERYFDTDSEARRLFL